jgi:hypothetical protein
VTVNLILRLCIAAYSGPYNLEIKRVPHQLKKLLNISKILHTNDKIQILGFNALDRQLADNSVKKQLKPGVNQVDSVLGLLSFTAFVKFLFFLRKKWQNFFDNIFFRPIISAFGLFMGI